MTLLVFAGPTLSAADISECLPDATVLPPAQQGDVWRAMQRYRPRAIGLIDGVFRGVRAVWHRELLWALSQGVHVLGAASMGALRAAELHPFGMAGIGRVFDAYRTGQWPGYSEPFEDDDEVAVEHAPAELGHAALSTSMVDLRDTLLAAEADGAIDRAERLRLTMVMKVRHYPERSFAALDGEAGQALSRYDTARKRQDAIALLEALPTAAKYGPFEPHFRFEATSIWRSFVTAEERNGGSARDAEISAVLDQLRLDPAAWRQACLAAEGRAASRAEEPADLRLTLSAFRTARGLGRRSDLYDWMEANALDEPGLERLLRTDPDRVPAAPPRAALVDELRASGVFAALLQAARQRLSLPAARLDSLEIDAALDWYWARLPGGRPASLHTFVAEFGWEDPEQFRAAVLASYGLANPYCHARP